MVIFLDLFALVIGELFFCSFFILLDDYCKCKKYKVKNTKLPMLKAKFDGSKTISVVAYVLQLLNYVYVLAYIGITILNFYLLKSLLLYNINFYFLLICSILAFIGAMVAHIFTPEQQGNE
jgi:hypothetical protein